MPTRAKRPCPRRACKGLWDGTTCTVCDHKPARWNWLEDKIRGTATKRGYDAGWRRMRAKKLADNPVCEQCGIAWAEEVHHVVPFRGKADPLRLAWSNLRSVCKPCHRKATRGRGTR